MLEVLPVVLFSEVKPFPIWFYLPLLDNDVSMHDLVELFVANPTSQRLSKTESGCKSYDRFRTGCLAVFGPAVVPPQYRPSTAGTSVKSLFWKPVMVVPLGPAVVPLLGAIFT